MATIILVMYLVVGVLFTLVSVSGHFDQYDQNDLITKFGVIAYLTLGWPYYIVKAIRINLKNC